MERGNILFFPFLFLFVFVEIIYRQTNTSRNRFLLLESRVVDSVENAKLAVGIVEKHKGETL